ncbi:hypothetical protein SAMN00790413_04051 [Deinococcus hopiensis KR-140]|uniref:Uncharacterized protein n=1 Tax=Deinococcus hopiensis KR-140 TaxID=695939 RepID=A0A1W1UNY1_9DEIO|nr:hypothetical protein SAMN00790413_04051 [Deinococcus hopiensis KR-140]
MSEQPDARAPLLDVAQQFIQKGGYRAAGDKDIGERPGLANAGIHAPVPGPAGLSAGTGDGGAYRDAVDPDGRAGRRARRREHHPPRGRRGAPRSPRPVTPAVSIRFFAVWTPCAPPPISL